MNWVLIILLAITGFLLIRHGKGLSISVANLFKNNVATLTATIIALIIAVLIVVIFQPQVLIGPNGVFGSILRSSKADTNLRSAALDPNDNPAIWQNQAAKAAADSVASEYQLATAKNKAGISAAEADRLSHLPKGHPDRALWDAVGMDPAEGSLPPVVQVAKKDAATVAGNISKDAATVVGNVSNVVGKIDLVATDESLSKPFGSPPKEVENWVRPIYNLPKGVVILTALLLLTVVVGMVFKTLLRSFRT